MSQENLLVLVTLLAYKLVLVGVGFWASRRTHSESDFFIAGQGLGAWVAGLSYAASTSSAWVLLGFSGFVYASGLSALWMVPGIWGGYAAVWLFFGRRLREETAERGHVTLTDFAAAGANENMKRLIAITASLFIVFCFVFYIAAQFGAAASAFETQFALPATEAVLLGAGVVLLYAILGGFWAVSVTDMLQGFLMLLVAVLLPAFAFYSAGGVSGISAALANNTPPDYLDPMGGMGLFLFLGFVLGLWGVGIGAMGQPHLLARLMAVKDEASRKRGFLIATGWAVLVYIGMATMALSGRALLGGGLNGEALFYQLANDLLPPILAGIVIAAILSAIMSTVDSILLSASAAVSHDMRLVKVWPGHEVLISRLTMVAITAIAIWMTLVLPATIFDRVLFAWAALGAAFGPIVVMRVLRFEPAGWAVLSAMIAGFGLTVAFNALGQVPEGSAGGVLAALRGLAVLPGDPFERVFPWVPALLLLWLGSTGRRANN
ncbi:MAG: sodium/proline symporter [Alphaproteobacteria bacterium]|nr:sodium/proline symporter [Alphaproteobacteria bacterium]